MIVNSDDYTGALLWSSRLHSLPHAVDLTEVDAFAFYFCGSRWMGGATSTSDWDFMVTDSPGVRDWLRAHGFESLWQRERTADSDELYGEVTDEVTRDVFERTSVNGAVVQVQLCDDAPRKFRTAQRIRDEHFEQHLHMTRPERAALWREVYTTV